MAAELPLVIWVLGGTFTAARSKTLKVVASLQDHASRGLWEAEDAFVLDGGELGDVKIDLTKAKEARFARVLVLTFYDGLMPVGTTKLSIPAVTRALYGAAEALTLTLPLLDISGALPDSRDDSVSVKCDLKPPKPSDVIITRLRPTWWTTFEPGTVVQMSVDCLDGADVAIPSSGLNTTDPLDAPCGENEGDNPSKMSTAWRGKLDLAYGTDLTSAKAFRLEVLATKNTEDGRVTTVVGSGTLSFAALTAVLSWRKATFPLTVTGPEGTESDGDVVCVVDVTFDRRTRPRPTDWVVDNGYWGPLMATHRGSQSSPTWTRLRMVVKVVAVDYGHRGETKSRSMIISSGINPPMSSTSLTSGLIELAVLDAQGNVLATAGELIDNGRPTFLIIREHPDLSTARTVSLGLAMPTSDKGYASMGTAEIPWSVALRAMEGGGEPSDSEDGGVWYRIRGDNGGRVKVVFGDPAWFIRRPPVIARVVEALDVQSTKGGAPRQPVVRIRALDEYGDEFWGEDRALTDEKKDDDVDAETKGTTRGPQTRPGSALSPIWNEAFSLQSTTHPNYTTLEFSVFDASCAEGDKDGGFCGRVNVPIAEIRQHLDRREVLDRWFPVHLDDPDDHTHAELRLQFFDAEDPLIRLPEVYPTPPIPMRLRMLYLESRGIVNASNMQTEDQVIVELYRNGHLLSDSDSIKGNLHEPPLKWTPAESLDANLRRATSVRFTVRRIHHSNGTASHETLGMVDIPVLTLQDIEQGPRKSWHPLTRARDTDAEPPTGASLLILVDDGSVVEPDEVETLAPVEAIETHAESEKANLTIPGDEDDDLEILKELPSTILIRVDEIEQFTGPGDNIVVRPQFLLQHKAGGTSYVGTGHPVKIQHTLGAKLWIRIPDSMLASKEATTLRLEFVHSRESASSDRGEDRLGNIDIPLETVRTLLQRERESVAWSYRLDDWSSSNPDSPPAMVQLTFLIPEPWIAPTSGPELALVQVAQFRHLLPAAIANMSWPWRVELSFLDVQREEMLLAETDWRWWPDKRKDQAGDSVAQTEGVEFVVGRTFDPRLATSLRIRFFGTQRDKDALIGTAIIPLESFYGENATMPVEDWHSLVQHKTDGDSAEWRELVGEVRVILKPPAATKHEPSYWPEPQVASPDALEHAEASPIALPALLLTSMAAKGPYFKSALQGPEPLFLSLKMEILDAHGGVLSVPPSWVTPIEATSAPSWGDELYFNGKDPAMAAARTLRLTILICSTKDLSQPVEEEDRPGEIVAHVEIPLSTIPTPGDSPSANRRANVVDKWYPLVPADDSHHRTSIANSRLRVMLVDATPELPPLQAVVLAAKGCFRADGDTRDQLQVRMSLLDPFHKEILSADHRETPLVPVSENPTWEQVVHVIGERFDMNIATTLRLSLVLVGSTAENASDAAAGISTEKETVQGYVDIPMTEIAPRLRKMERLDRWFKVVPAGKSLKHVRGRLHVLLMAHPTIRRPRLTLPPIAELQQQLVVPAEEHQSRGAELEYLPVEYVRIIPFAFSYLRMALFGLLVLATGGLLVIVSVWFPQVFTWIARIRLPVSSLGEAQFMLVQVDDDGIRSKWVEVPVQRPPKATTPPTTDEVAAEAEDEAESSPRARKSSFRFSLRAESIAGGQLPRSASKRQRSMCPWVWFEFKKHRYVFNRETSEFERYRATLKDDLERIRGRLETGFDAPAAAAKLALFGLNLVDIDPQRIPLLLFTKAVHPFYLFQVFSSVVWFCQSYTIYAIVILVLSAVSMTWEIYSEVSNTSRLRNLVRSDHMITVVRTHEHSDDRTVRLHETELVPGDIIELTTGPIVADVLLLSGNCVVDEASLTGEAVPINKEPAPETGAVTDATARTEHKASFLHAGSTITRIREACGPCRGVVLCTGFSTGKGELFRSIIFPRTIKFEFERDSYRYLAVLATIAIAAFVKRLVDFGKEGHSIGYTIVNSLDLITIAIPPALPLVLSSGISFALDRLRRRGIFCIDAQRINSCGQLTSFCFDKTGTLTEEDLQLLGADVVVPTTQVTPQSASPRKARPNAKVRQPTCLESVGREYPDDLRLAMGTCHGLSEVDGQLQGYSLEISMFRGAGLDMIFSHKPTRERPYVALARQTRKDGSQRTVGILKRFGFDPACQRSSVVVEDLATKRRTVFVKGSPEAIRGIAVDAPGDFQRKSLVYAAEGNYCIGFGMRELGATETLNLDDRARVESRVSFMGIALFRNAVKRESRAMLAELYQANVDVRMITGDNALTAVHVGRELAMRLRRRVAIVDLIPAAHPTEDAPFDTVYHCVDELVGPTALAAEAIQYHPFNASNMSRVLTQMEVALTGAALEQLRGELSNESLRQLLLRTQIFARIRPQQKAWIVERLMDYGYIVGMCGDGTNDCGALKAAHVGLALSSAEASIVAPFTSQDKAITDVPALIREGRCALTTSFLGFKYMVLYPIIQLAMASTLGQTHTMLTNNQYIWDDLAIVLVLSITMLHTAASPTLSRERPPHTLFSPSIVLSIVGQVALYVGFFAGTYYMLHQEPWFCRRAEGLSLVEYFVDPAAATPISDPAVLQNCAFYPDFIGLIDEAVEDIPYSHEDSTVWLWAHLAYYSVAFAFNLQDPFRRRAYTNLLYGAFFTTGLAVNLWFLLDPANVIDETFQTLPLPSSFRLKLLAMFLGQFAAAQVWEMLVRWVLPRWFDNDDDLSLLSAAGAETWTANDDGPRDATVDVVIVGDKTMARIPKKTPSSHHDNATGGEDVKPETDSAATASSSWRRWFPCFGPRSSTRRPAPGEPQDEAGDGQEDGEGASIRHVTLQAASREGRAVGSTGGGGAGDGSFSPAEVLTLEIQDGDDRELKRTQREPSSPSRVAGGALEAGRKLSRALSDAAGVALEQAGKGARAAVKTSAALAGATASAVAGAARAASQSSPSSSTPAAAARRRRQRIAAYTLACCLFPLIGPFGVMILWIYFKYQDRTRFD